MNHPIMFLDRDNKAKLVSASFSYSYERKKKLTEKCVTVIAVKISLHCKETN